MNRLATRENEITQRIKNLLLWSFDDAGNVNAEHFVTILEHEHVQIGHAALIALVCEMARVCRAGRVSIAGMN